MARNGAGTYVLPSGNPVVTGTTISSTTTNNTFNDIGTALTQSISSDGQTTPTANLPMGGYNHTNVANATVRTQYATAGQVQDSVATLLTSISGTNTIVATAPLTMSAYAIGQIFTFIPTANNTDAVTININAIGAKAITKGGSVALINGDLSTGIPYQIFYDGTQFQLLASSLLSALSTPTGSSLVGYIQAGTGATATTVQAKLRQSVSVKDFGAIGDGSTNDTTAIQAAINYARDNGYQLVFPNGTYKITSALVTQYDGNFKATNWYFDGGVIVADFDAASALNITGGAQPQVIQNIVIRPSTTYTMTGANYDTASHGITVTNSVVNLSGTITGFKGYGLNAVTSAANSNTSEYNLTIQTCNIGFYASGTNDNFSVVQAWLKIYNCAQSGFYSTATCPLRSWNAWIYAEANCTAVTSVAGVYVGYSTNSNWWIYSEQQNAANDITFDTAATGNQITSARYNKDTYSSGNIVVNNGIVRKNTVSTWTPTLAGSTTAGTQTYSVQKGYWMQEGNKVTVWGLLTLTAKDAATAGNLRINGLPINPGSGYTGMTYPIAVGSFANITITAGKVGFTLNATTGNSYLTFIDFASNVAASFTPVANLTATTSIAFSGSYLI